MTSCLHFPLSLRSSVTLRFSLPAQILWILLVFSRCRGCPVVSDFGRRISRELKLKCLSGEFGKCSLRVRPVLTPLIQIPPPPSAVLRRSFSLISAHHHRAGAVFLFGGGAPWGGATVWRRAVAGGGGSVKQGQRCGHGVSIPIWGAQDSRRWKWERQRETRHVEKPADAPRHLRRQEATSPSEQPAELCVTGSFLFF